MKNQKNPACRILLICMKNAREMSDYIRDRKTRKETLNKKKVLHNCFFATGDNENEKNSAFGSKDNKYTTYASTFYPVLDIIL